jgi:hypothetical protein
LAWMGAQATGAASVFPPRPPGDQTGSFVGPPRNNQRSPSCPAFVGSLGRFIRDVTFCRLPMFALTGSSLFSLISARRRHCLGLDRRKATSCQRITRYGRSRCIDGTAHRPLPWRRECPGEPIKIDRWRRPATGDHGHNGEPGEDGDVPSSIRWPADWDH